jgi:hypothetical protein
MRPAIIAGASLVCLLWVDVFGANAQEKLAALKWWICNIAELKLALYRFS